MVKHKLLSGMYWLIDLLENNNNTKFSKNGESYFLDKFSKIPPPNNCI